MASNNDVRQSQIDRISAVGCTRSGIITGWHPAACAARMPVSASSKTRQTEGLRPSFDAASRKMSGAGLPRSTSFPVTIASKVPARPAERRLCSTNLRLELVAIAVWTPP